jgi:hypothetical protein
VNLLYSCTVRVCPELVMISRVIKGHGSLGFGSSFSQVPENGAAAGCTVTVTCFVVIPPQPAAVKVYVVVVAGLTLLLPPALDILPMSLSMIADVALVMAPQVNVVEFPAMIGLGDAANDAITGGPGHAVGGGGFAGSGCEGG